MADEQSPTVEIAPTVIVSNSSEGENNGEQIDQPGDAAHADGDESISGQELVTDANTSDDVAIAAIEAERDITLAAIHSDVERERIELEGERIEAIAETNEEYLKCQEEISQLRGMVENLTETVNSLIPQPQLVAVTEELPIAPEPDLIQPDMLVPTAETRMEHLEESAEEEAAEIIPSRVRKFIAI